MSENPRPNRDEDEVPTIYGDSPGSEPGAPAGITGNEAAPAADTPSIYHAAEEESSGDS